MLVMGIGLSLWMNAGLAVIFLVCTPVLGLILFAVVRKVAPMYSRLQAVVDRLNNVVQEGLAAIRAVKAFVGGSMRRRSSPLSTTSSPRPASRPSASRCSTCPPSS